MTEFSRILLYDTHDDLWKTPAFCWCHIPSPSQVDSNTKFGTHGRRAHVIHCAKSSKLQPVVTRAVKEKKSMVSSKTPVFF